MKFFIQYKYKNRPLETIAEYPSLKEARRDLQEYRLSDRFGSYYISRRACKAWKKGGEL